MSISRTIMLTRMFARMLGRVPTTHLLYLLRRMRYEKPHRFDRQIRINTFFPPYPSIAFDRFCRAVAERRRVPYSTYLAVNAHCPFQCEHCSYAGRSDIQMSRNQMLDIVAQIKVLGSCTLGLTGGEPLLRDDLEEIIAAAAPEMACIVFTTGNGLNAHRAASLSRTGVTCVTIGMEYADTTTHDRVRGQDGSFAEAEAAAQACREAGIYLAISTLATREKLARGELEKLYALAQRWGAGEFRILAPVATGAWRGCQANMLDPAERRALAAFHCEHNRSDEGPAIASFAYLESDDVFGCGAGFHHLFIDAAGYVCPCDLTPLSFGDVSQERLSDIWNRMGTFFSMPRRGCLMGRIANELHKFEGALPLPRDISEKICLANLQQGELPEGYRRLLKTGQQFTNPR